MHEHFKDELEYNVDEALEEETKDNEEDESGIEMIDLYGRDKTVKKAGTKKQEDEEEPEEKVDLVKEIFSFLMSFLVAAAVALLVQRFVIINANIPSGSMENTIMTGDRLIGNRLSYLFEKPERGDIVIFKYPDDETQLFVKRVIGLPGETVTIEDAKVYIDGDYLLDEWYLKEEWVLDAGPYTFEVPEGCYFVMGDNRNNSKDARYWVNTYVEEDKILGKAVFRYWPFADIGILE